MFKPSVYSAPKLVDVSGLKLWSIENMQNGNKYYVIHPFWSKKYINELLGLNDTSIDFQLINSFEILHTPQNIF